MEQKSLREIRYNLGKTAKEMAKILDCNLATYYRKEKDPSRLSAMDLSRLLDLTGLDYRQIKIC